MKVSQKGRFRIQSVAETTGVPASTLRAWEQRYGFPSPERTASAYRVYSQQDIDRIAAVRAKCEAGMAPAQAVAAVLEGEAGAAAIPTQSPLVVPVAQPANTSLVDRIVTAAHAADPTALDVAIRSALMLGSHTAAFDVALGPAWAVLREQWVMGELDAGRARIALDVLGHAARDLIRLGQPVAAQGHALLAAIPGQDDLIPLVPVAFSAQAQSLRAVILGPRASVQAIGEAADQLDARLVAIAVSEAPPARLARETFDALAARIKPRPWSVCGPAAAGLRAIIERSGGQVGEPAPS